MTHECDKSLPDPNGTVEVDINLIADQGDGIEDMEKTSKKKTAKKKPPIKIKPEVRQNPKD